MRLLLVPVVLAWACTNEVGHAPVARIDITPPIDDPDGGLPLTYTWEIGGDEARIQQGTATSSRLTVRFLGARPATIRLTVTDQTGLSGTARVQLQLTIM